MPIPKDSNSQCLFNSHTVFSVPLIQQGFFCLLQVGKWNYRFLIKLCHLQGYLVLSSKAVQNTSWLNYLEGNTKHTAISVAVRLNVYLFSLGKSLPVKDLSKPYLIEQEFHHCQEQILFHLFATHCCCSWSWQDMQMVRYCCSAQQNLQCTSYHPFCCSLTGDRDVQPSKGNLNSIFHMFLICSSLMELQINLMVVVIVCSILN